MKVKALNAIKHDGETHGAGTIFTVDKESAAVLLEKGAVEASFGSEKTVEIDAVALYENTEDFTTLKVPELKAICVELGLPATGNKDDLLEAIAKSLVGEDDIDLDTLDEAALVALAKEENVDLPADADVEAMRDILAEALV